MLFMALSASVTSAEETQPFALEALFETSHMTLSSFDIDNLQTPNPSSRFGSMRAGIEARYDWGALDINLGIDALTFRLHGDPSNLGQSLGSNTYRERIDGDAKLLWLPRTAAIGYTSAIGRFQCGQQTSHWGLGLLINDGRDRQRFGLARNGNTNLRCLYATKPITSLPKLNLFLTGDAVYRDDNAQWRLGDRAYGGSIGIRYGEHSSQIGLLTSLRNQTDRTDYLYPESERTKLEVMVIDIFWRHQLYQGAVEVQWEGEIATIAGHTDRPYLEETYENGARVQSLGGATSISGLWQQNLLQLEVGYASGDNDPTDRVIRNFAFHSSYGMGLIFIDQVMPALSARAVDRVNDPSLIDVTPPSLRFLVNQGGFQGSGYVSPTAEIELPWGLNLRTTYFYFAGGPALVDIYQSNLNGGYNTSYGGQVATGASIGHEVNFRLGYTWSNDDTGQIRLHAESGVFLPGPALDGVIDSPIYALQLTTLVEI